jgi:hypothetical protein
MLAHFHRLYSALGHKQHADLTPLPLPAFACRSYELLLPQLDNMTDAVVAAPPSHSKGQRDKEARSEREREERERERQKAAAAAVKAQLAAQGTIRYAWAS